jgi:NADPH:quinone reductase
MQHWEAAAELIRPQRGIVSIFDTELPMPIGAMRVKAASLLWELMFAPQRPSDRQGGAFVAAVHA